MVARFVSWNRAAADDPMNLTARIANRIADRLSPPNYFFSSAGSAVPPLALHAFSDMLIQPLPLHPFWPLQALSADLQPPLPLHAFTPWQCTLPSDLAEAANGVAAENNPATAAAINTPLVVMFLSPRVYG
jgi:hypothetical protein